MKQIFLALIAALMVISAAAQTYNMEVSLKNGTKVTLAADSVVDVRFVESGEQPPAEEFNILSEEYIPDEALRDYIKQNIAQGADTYTNVQAWYYTGDIDLSDLKVFNISGLEYFTHLHGLNLTGSKLQTIDVTALTGLRELNVTNARYLTNLNITGLNYLESLEISGTKLYGFDLSILPPTIRVLNIQSLQYDSFDATLFPNLEILNICMNSIKSIDLSVCPNLKEFIASSNKLENINIGGCSKLKNLTVTYNKALKSLDIASCTVLENLYITATALSEIDLTPCKYTLKELCAANIKGINIKALEKCTNLIYLECQGTGMSGTIDFSFAPQLKVIRCEENNLTSVSVKNCNVLRDFHCYSMETLTTITMPADQSHLELINLFSIPNVTKITLGDLRSIKYLNIYYVNVKRLDLSQINRAALSVFIGYDNNLTEIKVWEGFDPSNPAPIYVEGAPNAVFVTEFSED